MQDNISKQVWNVINKDLSIKRDLSRNLISLRALARHIIKEYSLNTSIDAVVSAIRRYSPENKFETYYSKAENILHHSKISTKSQIVDISVEKDPEMKNLLPKLFSIINFAKGEVLRISQAEELIKIIIDEKNMKKTLEIIPKNKVVHIEKDLAEINIHLDKQATYTPGIVAVMFLELMNNGVNVIETMSCVPEMLLFVKEKDLLKAYETLFGLIGKEII